MELSPSSEPAGPWADPPEDIAIAIALSLRVERSRRVRAWWRIACDSDAVWECLFRRRWPVTAAEWTPRVQPSEVSKALQVRQVADRMVCVLVSPGRWFCHAWIPSETESSHKISLSELTVAEGSEVLDILNRLVRREQPHRVRLMEISNIK
ncbi:hypothetical protein PR202_gb01000 [Eleusine coracana subsp. coracana]|uniref:Uncharacterized protein n=1 Tax=Eleusine coracana subsp. coracana TaxID=191504 RepID=A0AAV5DUH5_ELECO|nr:hypothetical protein PR202_gb01000 [Eleusine coracana subsp. coracana]